MIPCFPLKKTQVEGIHRIGAALVNIERLRLAINSTIKDTGVPVRELKIQSLGFLAHDLEGVLFEHSCSVHQAAARDEMLASEVAA